MVHRLVRVRARTPLDDLCRQTDFVDRMEIRRLIDGRREREVRYLLKFALWWKEYIA
jgi:asparagine synthase (glutamine-hydrolysing)